VSRFFTAFLIAAAALAAMDPREVGSQTLAGRWSSGGIAAIQYRDARTGAPAPTSGNRFAYEFKPDGTYSFTGLMQNTLYHCTTRVYSHETGTYRIDGTNIAFNPQANPYKMTNSCAPSSDRESPGKLVNRSYRFRIGSDSENVTLHLTHPDGSVSSFRRDP
jgi:hypothetical protein